MKRIAFVVSSLVTGGIEKSLLELLKELSLQGHQITVVVMRPGGELVPEVERYATVTYAPKILYSSRDMLYMLKSLRIGCLVRSIGRKVMHRLRGYSLRQRLDAWLKPIPEDPQEYDTVVAYHTPYSLPVLYALRKMRAREKIAWIHVDVMSPGLAEEYSFTPCYREFHRIVCVSQASKQSFLKKHPAIGVPVTVIPNLMDESRIKGLASEPVALGQAEGAFICCTVGRLDPIKGYDLAINACDLLVKRGRKIKWYVCGEGPQRQALQVLIQQKGLEDSFILLGNQENPYPYMRQCDAYVQTSLAEGYCITLAEAKLLKKPVVTTNFPCAMEHIVHGENGFITHMDANSIACGIEALMDDPGFRTKLENSAGGDRNGAIKSSIREIFSAQ